MWVCIHALHLYAQTLDGMVLYVHLTLYTCASGCRAGVSGTME